MREPTQTSEDVRQSVAWRRLWQILLTPEPADKSEPEPIQHECHVERKAA